MSCTNCYNGCPDVVSDQCIKYTGPDFPLLGVTNGDTLRSVEEKIITSIQIINTGESILPDYASGTICTIIENYLPTEGNITLNDVLKAYMSAICNMSDYLGVISTQLAELNAPYTLDCLDGSISNTSTHDVLQGTINKLCQVDDDLNALELNVLNNYVRVDAIDDYIADYIDNSSTATLVNNKMIPYVVYEYHGPLSYFDASGAGIGDWIKIYLCNGSNNTPDKRGFVSVGVTTGMLGGALSTLVDPALPGNPAYTIGSTTGANSVGITESQLPSHTHTGVTNVTGAHSHVFRGYVQSGEEDGDGGAAVGYFTNISTESAGDHSHTLSINPIGGGLPHPNTQPGIGCYYIQYRP